MKTCLNKILSVFLVAVMFFTALPFIAFGADAPAFEVKQASKNGNEIVVNINLTKGKFNNLDLVFEMKGLECTNIVAGKASTDAGAMFLSNPTVSAVYSNVSMVAMNAVNPGTVAVVTLNATAEEYYFAVKAPSCGITDEDYNTEEVKPIINGVVKNEIAELPSLMGDVTLDDRVNSADALTVLQYSTGLISSFGCDYACADINKDNKITSIDALYILEFAVGLIADVDLENKNLRTISSSEKAELLIREVSNDGSKVVFSIDLVKGTLNSFDFSFDLNGLSCESIKYASGIVNNGAMVVSNPDASTDKYNISGVALNGIEGPAPLAEVTCKIRNNSYSFTMNADCVAVDSTYYVTQKLDTEILYEAKEEEPIETPVFTLKQKSVSGNKLVAEIVLESGTFNSLELVFEMEGLECTNIAAGKASTDAGALFLFNHDATGGVSNISMIDIEGVKPGTVAVVTLDIIESDYSFKVKARDCTVTDDNYNNIDVKPTINGVVKGTLDSHFYTHVYVPSTCEVNGEEYDICTDCGEIRNYTLLPLSGHKWSSWTVTKEPTFKADGREQRSCSNCGDVESRSIPRLVGRVHSVHICNISMKYKDLTTVKTDVEADTGVDCYVSYSSSDPSVVIVDENGNVYATGRGEAEITCTVTDEYGNTVSDTCEVEVKYSLIQWIIVIVLFGWIWY